ncbi:MAG: peptide chain release factor 2, partial [Clostridia bacterium]|nr:peptide chain release factor 2 [Clostridia bacterium]
MLEFEQLKLRLDAHEEELSDLKDALGLDRLKSEIEELENKAAQEGFWDDAENSQKILQKTGKLKNTVEAYENLVLSFDDLQVLIEMGDEEEDLSLVDEITTSIDEFETGLAALKLQTLLIGEYDKNNSIITFHAGAGGTEAMDWVSMLVRMYSRWSERHGFKVSVLDFLDGDEAGLKSATMRIEGENAYGYLKSESGVHRLVRVSPFDASGRRHTSFASLEVMPEIADDNDIDIREEDIKMDVFRSSGAGGQHINKTSSAVRLTHIPTGIVVA